ncbi:2-succinyl-6-hydroxy-2,4-cyclohexadiene-1-carboxylate synthase [Neobacillus sp. MM2021_6]|uniref:2-succinyl-6-hydroxy-2, 4-cyclohexadiene-1-carboxylate synthase n=1 Tax=Bacillaceae TaxID=186817 RepID=UPI00140D68FD|nr:MULTISPECIES: 2-succinyl-6-hydroxy-2,4-cyclohexadiene-1-carboxylate synthase [Bacillaceae]MBO0960282.1 2-succinyl-6-hydroxy-2,4-cyclohexadiene-1-carboxylate synthase [Neobacillus sp. MM2021_6]NHC17392.1 2-succinyl-6-hydroxy-2,4-cyclohexadiene-1-carboxylate synthase [Bacillus sp. MM2020_4]
MDITVDRIRYHVEVCGNGTSALVVLHGFTGDASTWMPFFESWGQHSLVIAPDIIGHGKTESPNEIKRYQIEVAASDLNRILDELAVEQIDLLGYSMGGRLALTFALLFPNRVRRLILESASPGLETEDERELRRMKDTELAKFIVNEGITSFVDYWEDIPLFSSMKRLPAEVIQSIRSQRLHNSVLGLANSLLGMGTGAQPSWWGSPIKKLECEVLLLTGAEDKKFCGIAERMLKSLKKGSWVAVENCGHAIHVEESQKFGTIVSDFLSKKR